ncbi:alpha/beta hydrolase fold domain-containing protein [Rubrivirga sp.]|uniref:alpha/beta hydrolase fold domain-containing protein n=1 Tax=Rubrivirga sp. TaxID=1885344 RepID=UPI003B522584
MPSVPHFHVAIVGTGFGGIGAAVRLMQEGVEDVVLFERADAVGGVWRDNTYPGAACDVESHLYAFSFAPNPDWSRRFSPQAEIRAYLEDVAERFGVLPHIRFGHDVRDATWDDDAARWRIETSRGPFTADVLVAAPGGLAEPRLPEIPGLDTFQGDVMHTARWDDAVEVDGRAVAVVGTGASAIQVVPPLQRVAETLTIYQRTPPWIIPRRDGPFSRAARERFRQRPALQRALRTSLFGYHETYGLAFRHPWIARQAEAVMARRHLRAQVPDPALRRVLTPDYRLGCKRILLSDDYYPALTRPNVTVVDGALVEVRERETVGADGVARPTDVIVFATGFYATEMPFGQHVAGRDGRRLSEVWGRSPTAHLGTTVAGFPNFFLIQGPNTGLGHSSVVLMAEAQIEHVANAVGAMRRHSLASVEPTAEAQQAWVDEVDRRAEGTVWTSGCESWYLDETGRNAAIWPGSVPAFRRRVAPFDPSEYRLRPLGPEAGDGAAGEPARLGSLAPTPDVPGEPSAVDRLRGAAARVVGRLPDAAQVALAGSPPPEVDGQRLDPATHAVLALNPREDGAALVRHDVEDARARYRRDTAAVTGTPTPVGAVRDLAVDGAAGPLDARLYAPAGVDRPPLLVFFHGGGYVEGDLDTHDEPCRLLCRQAGHTVLSVAYRLAPEHPFPAAVDDVVAAFRWAQLHASRLGTDASRVAVGGDSAGGALATVVAQATKGDAPPVAQLLLYPATDHPTWRPSRDLFDGYLLTEAERRAFFDVYTAGREDGTDWRISPIRGRLDGLAPALVVTAGFDVLRDEGEAYARALQAAGTPAALYRQADLPHGFIHLTSVSPSAKRATVAVARRWRQLVRET